MVLITPELLHKRGLVSTHWSRNTCQHWSHAAHANLAVLNDEKGPPPPAQRLPTDIRLTVFSSNAMLLSRSRGSPVVALHNLAFLSEYAVVPDAIERTSAPLTSYLTVSTRALSMGFTCCTMGVMDAKCSAGVFH
jgi:hypothetical protein